MMIRFSKQVAGDIKKAAKEASRVQQMETIFEPKEQAIKDMVVHEEQKEVSNLQTANSRQSYSKPADTSSVNQFLTALATWANESQNAIIY